VATLPTIRVDGQAAVFTVDQRRHRHADGELGHGGGGGEDRDRRTPGCVYRSEAEASFEEHIQAAMTGSEDDAPAVIDRILQRYS